MACTWYDNNKNIIKIICTQCNVLIIIHEAMSALLMDKKGSHKICLEVWPKGLVGYHWLRIGHFQQLSSGSKIKFFSYTNTWLGDIAVLPTQTHIKGPHCKSDTGDVTYRVFVQSILMK